MKNIRKIIICTFLIITFCFIPFSFSFADTDTDDLIFNIDLNENNVEDVYVKKVYGLSPGARGKIIVNIRNLTENYLIEGLNFFEEENKPTNLYFIYNNKKYNNLAEINMDLKNDSRIEAGKQSRIEIEYIWKFETGNTADEIADSDKIDVIDSGKTYNFKFRLQCEVIPSSMIDKIIKKKSSPFATGKLPRTGTELNKNIIYILGLILFAVLILVRKENK